jgi:hypothetical protein
MRSTPANTLTTTAPRPPHEAAAFLWTFRVCVYGLLLIAIVLGGPVVRIAAIAGGIFAVVADRAGAVRHILHLACLPILIILARKWGLPLGTWLVEKQGLAAPVGLVAGVAAIIIVGVLITAVVGHTLTGRLNKNRYLYVLNRAGGSLLGVGEGALFAAVLTWLLCVFGPTLYLHGLALTERYPRAAEALGYLHSLRVTLREDPAGRWLQNTNPLEKVPQIATVAALGELSADPGLFWRIVEAGELRKWLEDPLIRQHFETVKADPEVREAIDRRDLRTLLRSPHLTAALEDDALCRAIADRWPDLRARLAREDVNRARQLAARLDGDARTRYEQAVRRAQEFGVELP